MSSSEFDKYQEIVTRVQKYSKNPDLYLVSKLSEEVGELAKEFIKKEDGLEVNSDMRKELGDIIWCVAAIAENNGILLSEVIEGNIEKLRERNLL